MNSSDPSHLSQSLAAKSIQNGGQKWKRYVGYASRFLGLFLLVGALYVLQKEFRQLSIQEILLALKHISKTALWAAAGCTVLSYLILSFYDRLAIVQVGHQLGFLRTTFAAFCSYVLSHNLGFAAISGAMVRFRLYGSWGLKPLAIVQIIAFCSITYLLGAAVLIGTLFIIKYDALPVIGGMLPPFVFILLGILALLAVFLYVVCSFFSHELKLFKYRIALPKPRMAIAQIIVATAEVVATAAIAYCLIPLEIHLDFGTFLAIYIVSYTAGLVASIPGGLGVFDGVMMLTLSPYMRTSSIVSIILVFRLFYYIIPLFLAGIMFAGHELFLRSNKIIRKKSEQFSITHSVPMPRSSELIRESDAAFSVIVATAALPLCGIMVLVLPILDPPSWTAGNQFFLYVELIGDYLLSLCGAGLLALTVAFSRRITAAWGISLFLLMSSVTITLLRGAPLFVPSALALLTVFIVPFRNCYYRKTHFSQDPLSWGTALEVFLLLAIVFIITWIGHRNGIDEGWIKFFFSNEVSSENKWIFFLSVLLGLIVIYRLMRPGKILYDSWTTESEKLYRLMQNAQIEILSQVKPTGMLLCSDDGTVFPFVKHDDFLIGLGDPAGKESGMVNAIWQLRDLATQEKCSVAFWLVGKKFLSVYQDLGLAPLLLEDTEEKYVCCETQNAVYILNLLEEKQINLENSLLH